MQTAPPELTVITMTYDLLVWTAQHVARFPRSHRFTAGDRLDRQLYLVLDTLLRAKYTRERGPLLRQVNLELEVLRFQFRLAKDLKCLSLDSYGHAARTVNEMGQMVGGWLKATAPPQERPPAPRRPPP
jgi:hypothetical protein